MKKAEETRIGWKGSPLFELGDGQAFKVKGRIQYDAGYLSVPDSVNDRATGFSNELRRLRLGAEAVDLGLQRPQRIEHAHEDDDQRREAERAQDRAENDGQLTRGHVPTVALKLRREGNRRALRCADPGAW